MNGPAIVAAGACVELLFARLSGGPLPAVDILAAAPVWIAVGVASHRWPLVAPGALGFVAALWTWPMLTPLGWMAIPVSVLAAVGVLAARDHAAAALWLVGAALCAYAGLSAWTLLLPLVAIPLALHEQGWKAVVFPLALAVGAPPRSASGPDILLITVDALRADRLPMMPNAQALALRGAHWPRATANSSWTLPSMASLHQGRAPDQHRAGRTAHGFRPPDRVRSLAMELQVAGYRTVAISGGNVFTGVNYGLLEGFDVVRHPWSSIETPFPRWRNPHAHPRPVFARWRPNRMNEDAPSLVAETTAALDRAESSFVWLHLMDVHLPYAEAPCRPEILTAPGTRPALVDDPWWSSPPGIACLTQGYDAAVSRVDDALAPLLERDNTWIVLTSDHGEALGEVGLEHGHTLDPVVTRIPLVIAGPEPVSASDEPVDLIDVHATLGAISGARLSSAGRDLRHNPLPPRVIEPMGLLYPL